ncbi:MAG: hypothetical protein QNJ36_10215 [Calothrix sp. MO_167.B42]|nr:hypothetical protein [Calothrix sp. MO_167.B42]
MKKQYLKIAIAQALTCQFAIFCLAIVGCNNSAANTANQTTNTALPTQKNSSLSANPTPVSNESGITKETDIFQPEDTANKQPVTPNKTNNKSHTSNKPKVATIKNMITGDLKCYLTLVDEKNTEREIGATFEVCEKRDKLLNKKVNLKYKDIKVNDCESAEPCGKTKIESLIYQMELVGGKSSTTSNENDSHTISNGEWTITIGNGKSWSGVNGTGNLSYRGCNSKGECLELTGGKVICRQGICTTGWTNGEYTYIVKQPITEDDKQSDLSTTLEVRKNGKIILSAKGFKTVN